MTDGASAWAVEQELKEEYRKRKEQKVEIRQIAHSVLSVKPGSEEHERLLYLQKNSELIYKYKHIIDLLR